MIKETENKIFEILTDESIKFNDKIAVLVNVHKRLYEQKNEEDNEGWEKLEL